MLDCKCRNKVYVIACLQIAIGDGKPSGEVRFTLSRVSKSRLGWQAIRRNKVYAIACLQIAIGMAGHPAIWDAQPTVGLGCGPLEFYLYVHWQGRQCHRAIDADWLLARVQLAVGPKTRRVKDAKAWRLYLKTDDSVCWLAVREVGTAARLIVDCDLFTCCKRGQRNGQQNGCRCFCDVEGWSCWRRAVQPEYRASSDALDGYYEAFDLLRHVWIRGLTCGVTAGL